MKKNECYFCGVCFLFVRFAVFCFISFKGEMEGQPSIRNAIYLPGIMTFQAWN